MLWHKTDDIESKKNWLKNFFLAKKIQVPDEELEKIIEAFSLPEAEEN